MAAGALSSALERISLIQEIIFASVWTASKRMAHSHTTKTLQPSAISASIWRASREAFPVSFASQNSRRVPGILKRRHPVCLCQKHPWTNTTAFQRRNTMSGLPGNDRVCSRNRRPSSHIRRRTNSSGDVSFPRIFAIAADRCAGVITSATPASNS